MKAEHVLRMFRMALAAPLSSQNLISWMVMRAVNHLEMALLDRAIFGEHRLVIWTIKFIEADHYDYAWRTLIPECGAAQLFVPDSVFLSQMSMGQLTLDRVNTLFDLPTKMALALLIEDGYQLLLQEAAGGCSLVLSCVTAE